MEPETSPVDAPPAENQSEDGGNLEIAESGSEKERSVTPEEAPVAVDDVQFVEEVQEVAEQENNDGEPMDLEEDDEEEGIEVGNGENVEEQGQEEGEEDEEEDDEDDEEEDVVHDEESIAKSKIQKDSFLEMFRIAPRVRDVLPDLRTFINHPDVIKQDKMEIQQLVELKIQEEKAKKKAEKEKEKEMEKEQAEAAEKPPIDLAQAIRNVTGLDLAGILNKASQRQAAAAAVPVSVPSALPPTINLVPPALPVQIVPAVPPELANAPTLTLGTSAITAIRVGKAGFSTPHPAETAAAIQAMRPEVAPIPEELIQNHKKSEVPPIPNELLPLDQRVPVAPDPVAEPVYSLARPPIRKTLLMAGARPGKRVERRKALAAEEDKSKRASSRKSTSSRSDRDRERDRERDRNRERERERDRNRPSFDRKPERRTGRAGFGGSNSLPSDLNMNTPLPVKRYHARQLAKDTGITFEKAMEEIEEQCAQFHKDDQEAHDANAAAMETLMRRGDRNFNQRNNYVPADHSAGIPGVDRPPGGARMGRSPDRDVGRRDGGIPGVDRPPGGGRMDRDQDFGRRDLGIPGVDRPPGGGRMDRDREMGRRDAGLPNRERGPYGQGTRPRKRGGVKEREKQRRREEMRRSGGNYGGGEWDRDRDRDRDRWADNGRGPGGPPNKQGRYDVDQPPQSYADFANSYQQESGAYEGTQDYQGYYEGQEGYQQYDQTGSEGYANYEYYQGQEGQQEGYYQEDGSQYYNEYYGTSDAPQEGYQATFAAPGETRPAE